MKARGKGSIGFSAGNGNGGLSQSSFDAGASSDNVAATAAERKRREALAKLEAFGEQKKRGKKTRKRDVLDSSPSCSD